MLAGWPGRNVPSYGTTPFLYVEKYFILLRFTFLARERKYIFGWHESCQPNLRNASWEGMTPAASMEATTIRG
jgi:hypothetical protein